MSDDTKTYNCSRCGETFPKEKALKTHAKDCEMTVWKRFDDMLKNIALIIANQADFAKKLSQIEKKIGPVEDVDAGDIGVALDDMTQAVHYAVKDGKLYKYSTKAKTFALADIESMIKALVKGDYVMLL